MKSTFWVFLISSLTFFIFSGCIPDKTEIEIYTSDFLSVLGENGEKPSIVGVPVTSTFNMLGDDEEGLLPKATAILKKYLDEESEFKISEGLMGPVLVVKFRMPMGTIDVINSSKNSPWSTSPYFIVASKLKGSNTNYEFKLSPGSALKSLNQELQDLDFSLEVESQAISTFFRFIGDDKNITPVIRGWSVWIDEQAHIESALTMERRKTLEYEFKGAEGSIWSQLPIQFWYEK